MGSLTNRTTHLKRWNGSGFVNVGIVKKWNGTSFVEVASVKRWNGSAWIWLYSTPDVTISGSGGNSGAGASASGSVSKTGISAVPGGNNSGNRSYAWTRNGESQGFDINNASLAGPTWTRSFAGVANGSTSTTGTESWRVTMTDGDTDAAVVADVTVGPFSWENTIPAFSGRTDYITNSQSVPTPAGASSLTVYVVGGGAQGGAGFNDGMGTEFVGGGASGAGQAVKTISGPNGSYSCTVGAAGFGSNQGGTSSVSGSGISASATGGYAGMSAGSGGWGDAQSSVGGASGGDANYSGNAGFAGFQGGQGGFAGANGGPYNGDYWGHGGNGGGPFAGGDAGKQGIVVLVWSP